LHTIGNEIYPLTTVDIAAAQRVNAFLKHLFKRNALITIEKQDDVYGASNIVLPCPGS
jgi:hypothetical protein